MPKEDIYDVKFYTLVIFDYKFEKSSRGNRMHLGLRLHRKLKPFVFVRDMAYHVLHQSSFQAATIAFGACSFLLKMPGMVVQVPTTQLF